MEERSARVLVLLFVVALGSAVMLGAGYPQRSTDRPPEEQARAFVRTVNTAEVMIFNSTKQYASLTEVLKQFPQGRKDLPVLTDASSGTFLDYRVSVFTTADGQHYVVEAIPLKEACNPAVFSNEAAILYTATALGCPQEANAASGVVK